MSKKERFNGTAVPRNSDPDLYPAIMAARNRVTDAGVKFALAAAEAGVPVVYASDWSPGQKAEEALEAAGVEVVICRPRRER